ncbi:MAG: hypothetical protein V6Z86_03900 [Hyphomicrobiales bacterium]
MTVFRRESIRAFLRRGSHLAVAMSAGRLNGLIFLTALASVSAEAVAAYGIGSFLFSALSTPLTGLRIFVVGQRGQGSEIEKIAGFPEGFLLATLLSLSLFIMLPVALTIWGHGLFGDLPLYLVFRGLGMPLIGVNSVLGGYLVRAGRENVLLRITTQAICIWAMAAVALTIIPFAKQLYLLGFVGFVSFSVQIYRFCRYARALGLSRRTFTVFLPDNSWGAGCAIARKSLAAGADIIVLLLTLWIILTSLGAIDPAAAAYTSIGFSITKLFLLPLKSFGLVAGRMLNAPKESEEPRTTERALFRAML